MNKRDFFRKASSAFLAGALWPVTSRGRHPQQYIEGKFIHMVFFWLKEGTDTAEFINNTERFLKKVEVIRQYHLGTPAMTPREVVDNSYGASLVVVFDSKADQDTYQHHAAHLAYIKENEHLWTQVKIYDSWSAL